MWSNTVNVLLLHSVGSTAQAERRVTITHKAGRAIVPIISDDIKVGDI